MALLLGNKVYIAKNNSKQGPGSSESDADFVVVLDAHVERVPLHVVGAALVGSLQDTGLGRFRYGH